MAPWGWENYKIWEVGYLVVGREIECSRKCDFLPLLGTRDCYCLACEGEGSELVDD